MNSATQSFPDLGGRARFKAWARTTFAAICSLSGMAWLWRASFARHGVRILAYHGVEPVPTSPFSVALEQFERQIAYLATNFEIVDLNTVLRWQSGEYTSHHPHRPMIALTFDDGFLNNLQHAAPVLKRHKVPATFFIIGGKLDGSDKRFMTGAQVGELVDHPDFSIGSHTVNHRSVAQVDDPGRDHEIGASKTLLETRVGRPVKWFCYPYGTFNDFDDRSIAALKQHGYQLALTSVNGINFANTDPFRLRRTKVEWSDDFKTFQRLANGALDGWFFVDFFLRFLQRPRAVRFEADAPSADKTGSDRP